MKSFYAAPVNYFEVSFTLPNPKDSKKIKANFETSLLHMFEGMGLDVHVDARYGKEFEHVHFNLEFPDEAAYLEVKEDLFKWLSLNNAL